MQETQETFLAGTTVHVSTRDRYVIESLLGRGGFSAIYLVRDQRVRQNLYALKEVINPDKREREGFTFECAVLMRLEHPALPRVYRVFEDSKRNRAYVLMDYIEGPNLKALLLEQPNKRFSLPQVIDIMAPIVSAVSFLHSQNPPIVHRDIKPANIIVPTTGTESVLVDFGIAKTYEPEATTTAVRYCSPGYGAPEQYSIGTTPRTDIYGLGATIYTLLTGTIPADALQRMIELNEKKPDPLVPVNQLAPAVPANAARVLHRALSTRSTTRFASVEEFWQDFTTGVERQRPAKLISPPPPPPLPRKTTPLPEDAQKHTATITLPGKAQTFMLKKPAFLAALVLSILLLIGLVVGTVLVPSLKHGQPASTQASTPTLSATSRASTTPTPTTPLYPPVVKQYNGTISDIVTGTTTKMSLSSLEQTGAHIRGTFTGLGLTGPLTGTVDLSGHIQFHVVIYAGSETIAFEGTIKLGGILAGSYQILNQNQQFTGESGLWSVSPPA